MQPWTPTTLGSSGGKTFDLLCFALPCPTVPCPALAQPPRLDPSRPSPTPHRRPSAPTYRRSGGGALRYRTHPTRPQPRLHRPHCARAATCCPSPPARSSGARAAVPASAPPNALAQPRDALRPPGGRLPPKKGRKRWRSPASRGAVA